MKLFKLFVSFVLVSTSIVVFAADYRTVLWNSSSRSIVPTNLSLYGSQIPPIKLGFWTNYTVTTNDCVLFCAGTNQLITLPSAVGLEGRLFTIISSTTNGNCTVTNYDGTQTVLGIASQYVPGTNRLTVISDGANYW